MPAPGYTPIILYHSNTASAVPSTGNLINGEIAINIVDKKIYMKSLAGALVTVMDTMGGQSASSVAITGGTIAGVAFTGGSIGATTTGTTAAPGTNTTVLATTAFANAAAVAAAGALAGTLGTMSVQNANSVAISGGTISGITDLAVADGGTGSSTLTANAVLLGNGTSALQAVAPGTAGNLLTSDGTTWNSTTLNKLTSATAQASTSGTSITFGSIPSWVKRITVLLSNVSLNNSAATVLRLGTSGGIVATGYVNIFTEITGSPNNAASTTGFQVDAPNGAATVTQGLFTIANITGNTWVFGGTSTSDGANNASTGSIALSGTLTQLSITTVTGTPVFDAGVINIMYE